MAFDSKYKDLMGLTSSIDLLQFNSESLSLGIICTLMTIVMMTTMIMMMMITMLDDDDRE